MKREYKVKSWNNFTNEWEIKTIKIDSDYGETATDSTHYKPNVNVWDDVNVGASITNGVYDFADGKDDGDRTLQMLRNPKLDRVETDAIMKDAIEKGNEVAEKLKETMSESNEQNEEIATENAVNTTTQITSNQ